jgi:hypothetical protein
LTSTLPASANRALKSTCGWRKVYWEADQFRSSRSFIPIQAIFELKYQRRLAVGHPFRDKLAEVLRLGAFVQQSLAHENYKLVKLLIIQNDQGGEQWIDRRTRCHYAGPRLCRTKADGQDRLARDLSNDGGAFRVWFQRCR